MRVKTLAAAVLLSGCSLVTVQQDPFPPLQISAERPDAPPARVVLTPSNIQINDKVQFELGSDKLLEVSFPLLDEVAGVMKDNEQIEVIEIAGHTDASGGAKRNRELSQQRAESVRKYLIAKGITKGRMTAKGYGPDAPIADNTTPEGAEANRRVEFVIKKQGPKKTLVQEE
jgi:outer membrane protein OmpA-like peptidoglycan-associated protein